MTANQDGAKCLFFFKKIRILVWLQLDIPDRLFEPFPSAYQRLISRHDDGRRPGTDARRSEAPIDHFGNQFWYDFHGLYSATVSPFLSHTNHGNQGCPGLFLPQLSCEPF
jgi:hypothetical protein